MILKVIESTKIARVSKREPEGIEEGSEGWDQREATRGRRRNTPLCRPLIGPPLTGHRITEARVIGGMLYTGRSRGHSVSPSFDPHFRLRDIACPVFGVTSLRANLPYNPTDQHSFFYLLSLPFPYCKPWSEEGKYYAKRILKPVNVIFSFGTRPEGRVSHEGGTALIFPLSVPSISFVYRPIHTPSMRVG